MSALWAACVDLHWGATQARQSTLQGSCPDTDSNHDVSSQTCLAPASWLPGPAPHLVCCVLSNALSCLQLPLLRDRWKLILFGACFQYVHGMATQLAHRVHQPMRYPLHDVGFAVLPVS